MCSFGINIFITNVSLIETMKICTNTLYWNVLLSQPLAKEVFVELMESATKSVDFSLNNRNYWQKLLVGVVMSRHLDPTLVNVLWVYMNNGKLFPVWRWYFFKAEGNLKFFFQKPYSLHLSLKYTSMKENVSSIFFLVLIEESVSIEKLLLPVFIYAGTHLVRSKWKPALFVFRYIVFIWFSLTANFILNCALLNLFLCRMGIINMSC